MLYIITIKINKPRSTKQTFSVNFFKKNDIFLYSRILGGENFTTQNFNCFYHIFSEHSQTAKTVNLTKKKKIGISCNPNLQ